MSQTLAQRLGHTFSQPRLLAEALTHRSFGVPHNERLEFIGDGALNCAVALHLYERFPSLAEGQLSRLRAAVVSREPLARVAVNLSLGDSLRLGEGEVRSGGRERPSILADAVEAIIGAIVIDAGFDAARAVVLKLFADELAALTVQTDAKDPKTALQEWLQARKLDRPHYLVREIAGAQHAQTFHVICKIAARGIEGSGEGISRRAAEQAAATQVLEKIQAEKMSV